VLSANQSSFLDTTFANSAGVNGEVLTLVRQRDGKVLLVGSFTAGQGMPRNRVCRVLGTGVVDRTFNQDYAME